jgi:hypothetical protein
VPSDDDIRAYETRRSELERLYADKFVVFHGGELFGAFDDIDSAGNAALERFGNGTCLIRKVGEATNGRGSISIIRS